MEESKFEVQVIAKGSFVDDAAGDGGVYLVEAFMVRLNHVALNRWILSEGFSVRECYPEGVEGDIQWEAHKAEYLAKRDAWIDRVTEILGIDPRVGSVKITQAQSEVFSVVHIRKT